MRNKQYRRRILSGIGLLVLAMGCSDTARAQTVTISSGGQPLSGPLNFTVAAGAVSQAQTLNVATPPSNGNTLQVTVPAAYQSWLKVNPTVVAVTPGQVAVSVDATSLSQGTQSGNFSIQILNNPASAQTVYVNATVTGNSALSASPSSLSFTAQAGQNFGSPQSCAIKNTSSTCQVTILSSAGTLRYNVTTSPASSWLQVDQASGSTSGIPLNVGVNASNLTPGSYTGQILIQSQTTNDSVTIAVSLTVTANATLTATPTQLNFYYTTGNPAPAPPPAQQVAVSSNGGLVPFSITQSANSTWLHVTPISGAASSTSPVSLSVSVTPTSPTALLPGPYQATITIGGATVNVSLIVSPNPFLTVTSNQLAFSAQFGGSSPAVQGITVGSTSTASLNFTASATSDQGWLTVNGASQTTGTTGTASAAVSAGVSQGVLSTLAIGQYNGTITIVPGNGDPYSIKIPVTLSVGAFSQILAAPDKLYFSYEVSQTPPPAQTVSLLASGPDTGFTVQTQSGGAANCGPGNWLSAVPQNAPETTPNTLIVSVNTQGMTAGNPCTGTVRVMYTGAQPAETDIQVTLFVSNSALLSISLPQGFGLDAVPLQTNSGGGIIQHQIAVSSTDPNTNLAYTVSAQSSPCNWLSAAAQSGSNAPSTPTPIVVQITPGCITTPGLYMGSVAIASTAGLPSPASYDVMLIVTSNVQVSVTPQSVTFHQTQGGPAPAAQNLNFTVSGGNANFLTTAQSDFGWLSVKPASGSTSIGSIAATVNSNMLPQGKYNGVITLSFQNAETPSATVLVQLIVGPAQTLAAGSQTLSFSYQQGGPAPASQQLMLTSTGGSADFTIATTSNGGWLSVDSASGSTGSSGSKTINVSVDPTKIPSGTQAGTQLQGSLMISSPVLPNPITVNVTLSITAAPAPAVTTISTSAVNNGFGAIAPGQLIALKGTNLGPPCVPLASCTGTGGAVFTVNANGTVSSTLGGVQVLFDNIPGTPTFVSPTQINVIVPWEIAGRTSTSMVVMYNNVPSAAVPLQVTAVAPGIYTQNATGSGQAAAVNLSSSAASIYNGPAGQTYAGTNLPTAPAPQGSFIALFLTGGGVTNPASATGSVNPSNQLLFLKNWTPGSNVVTATIGGQPATVQFAGAAPTLINGVVQINLQVPNGVTGNALPVVVTIDGITTQTTATVAVQ